MNSYIKEVNKETRLFLNTVFCEYVKDQQLDEVHNFSSDAANGILTDSSEITDICHHCCSFGSS